MVSYLCNGPRVPGKVNRARWRQEAYFLTDGLSSLNSIIGPSIEVQLRCLTLSKVNWRSMMMLDSQSPFHDMSPVAAKLSIRLLRLVYRCSYLTTHLQ